LHDILKFNEEKDGFRSVIAGHVYNFDNMVVFR